MKKTLLLFFIIPSSRFPAGAIAKAELILMKPLFLHVQFRPFRPLLGDTLLLAMLLFGALLLSPHQAAGQTYSYRHYTIKDGLPQSQVISLYQDQRGYMWIGTKVGLSRFDGVEFKSYYRHDGLNSDYIEGIIEDTTNTLYALTPMGYNKFTGDTILSYQVDTNINLKWTAHLEVDSSNAIWARLKEERDLIRFKNGGYTFMRNDGIIPDSLAIHSFFYDEAQDRIYFSSGADGIFYLKNNRLHHWWDPQPPSGLEITQSPDGTIYGIASDSIYRFENKQPVPAVQLPQGNSAWFSAKWHNGKKTYIKNRRDRLYAFNGQQLKPIQAGFESIYALTTDEEGNLWVGMETGLMRSISRKFVNFNPEQTGMLPYVYSVIEDSSQNLYFASLNKGLVKYNREHFSRIRGYHDVYSFDRFYMGAICDHKNHLILPTKDGAIEYTGESFSKIQGLPRWDAVLDVYEDPKSKVKLFASEGGLFIQDHDGKMQKKAVKPGGDPKENITSIIKDSTGRYWLGGFKWLSWMDQGKTTHLPNSTHGYEGGAICLYRDYKQNIWLGTREGLYLYDYDSFQKVAGDKIYSYVVSLTGVDSSTLVLGMINQMATLNLQAFYQKGQEVIKTYNHTNGFMGNECIQNGLFTDSKGHVWIPTSDRVVKFMPEKGKKKNIPPRIYIKKISRLNEQMQWVKIQTGGPERMEKSDASGGSGTLASTDASDHSVTFGSSDPSVASNDAGVPEDSDIPNEAGESVYKLPHTINNLRFHYTGIDFSNPKGVRYQYKLAGNDEGWSEMTRARYATYTNLEPGVYTFKVRACNGEGIWSKRTASISVHIRPALWQKTWFIIVCGILGAIATIMLLYYFTQRHKLARQRRAEYDKKLAEMKLLTVKNQLEPHFTFNAINSMAAVVLKNENLKAYDYLSKFSKLIRLSLDHSENILRTLREELDFVGNYLDLQKLRFDNKFSYQINLGEEVDTGLEVPKMIVHNYVENAVKHGIKHKKGKGFIQVSIFHEHRHLHIVVQDNGIGRKKAREIGSDSSGRGLQTLREYCRIFNKYNREQIHMQVKDLHDNAGRAAGTRVDITIPLSYQYNIQTDAEEQNYPTQ